MIVFFICKEEHDHEYTYFSVHFGVHNKNVPNKKLNNMTRLLTGWSYALVCTLNDRECLILFIIPITSDELC